MFRKTQIITIVASIAAVFSMSSDAHAGTYVGTSAELWPDGIVPYEWAPDMIEDNKQKVLDAMLVWESVANIDFVPRNGEDDYVLIQNAGPNNGSNARVGRGAGGARTLNIREDWTNWSEDGILYGLSHEVGHILGFHHTHQRPDRAMYIDVIEERINDCSIANFDIEADSLGWPRDVMDFDSVMSYGQCIFSTCNYDFNPDCECGDENCIRWDGHDCDIEFCCEDDAVNCRSLDILPPNESFQGTMGQRNHLSDIDMQLMQFLYPPANWRFMEKIDGGLFNTGSFHRPFPSMPIAQLFAPDDSVVWIVPDTFENADGVYDKPMLYKATHGTVVLR
ncbi:MAG: hypothetical protein H6819_00805 [Phycisphaerales bacterium]|nr:hypothetical protein [Phycisphaerales bacterium]MCB9857253.1 hypothetical protein [Phycisphaerales bacterium]MCB9863033.1 hypothetical protein [Phycisphaerales bacterium]